MVRKYISLPLYGAGVLLLSGTLSLATAQAGGRIDPDQLSKYGGPTSGPQAAKDKLFLHQAAEDGMGEIEISKLALTKATRDDVKAFAQTMVDDHTKLNDTMKPIAESLQASIPKKMSKSDQSEYNKLNGLSGPDFDKEYLAYSLKGHKKDLQAFNDEAQTAADPTLSSAVQSGQKMIAAHLAKVQQLSAASSS